jgi:hypothetical protein
MIRSGLIHQGILTEVEGSVQLTSCTNEFISVVFCTDTIFFYYTRYLKEELNSTVDSPSVRVPCLMAPQHSAERSMAEHY